MLGSVGAALSSSQKAAIYTLVPFSAAGHQDPGGGLTVGHQRALQGSGVITGSNLSYC